MSKPNRNRKGAVRRSGIPPDVLQALNEGRDETITLVEWLAIDAGVLLSNILPDLGLQDQRSRLLEGYGLLRDEGITGRVRGVGKLLFEAMRDDPRRDEIFEGLATHTSDMVRAWAAFTLTADKTLSLEDRLARTRRFAVDRSVAVRECAWDSFRPHIRSDLPEAFRLLEGWVVDDDPNVRRCAVEGARPRGVWTQHMEALKEDPSPGLGLLEPVRSDDSRYVQTAVANWLNDASKSHPEWVREVCARWNRESPSKETAWTVNHALRTLRKQGVV